MEQAGTGHHGCRPALCSMQHFHHLGFLLSILRFDFLILNRLLVTNLLCHLMVLSRRIIYAVHPLVLLIAGVALLLTLLITLPTLLISGVALLLALLIALPSLLISGVALWLPLLIAWHARLVAIVAILILSGVIVVTVKLAVVTTLRAVILTIHVIVARHIMLTHFLPMLPGTVLMFKTMPA
jgi:hypothetical protein